MMGHSTPLLVFVMLKEDTFIYIHIIHIYIYT